MTAQRLLISVISCAHNEEEYVDRFLPKLLSALKGFPYEIIFVADRCTDRTVEKVRKHGVRVIEKKWKKWKNSYAESLQTGYRKAKGKYIGIIDVDIMIPTTLFRSLVPMLKGGIASVDARLVTYPDTFWNRFIYAWEKTYDVAPLGRGHYGGARVMLKRALDEIGGFRDVFAIDTDVDIRLAERGYRSVSTSAMRVYHARRLSPRVMVKKQMRAGRARCMIDYGFMRTIAHAAFRFRPFVVGGWFMEWTKKRQRKNVRC